MFKFFRARKVKKFVQMARLYDTSALFNDKEFNKLRVKNCKVYREVIGALQDKYYDRKSKVEAIKLHRAVFGLGLKESKAVIDSDWEVRRSWEVSNAELPT